MKNEFVAVTMPELRAEVLRLSKMVDYYRAEAGHITPKNGALILSLIERALCDTLGDLNGWPDMSESTSELLNEYYDHLNEAKAETLTLCPSLEV